MATARIGSASGTDYCTLSAVAHAHDNKAERDPDDAEEKEMKILIQLEEGSPYGTVYESN
jgi:hypothetical protein